MVHSGHPGNAAMTPLEREWAREQGEREKEAEDMAAALALQEEQEVAKNKAATVEGDDGFEYDFTNEHRHVPRFTIDPISGLDPETASKEEYTKHKADSAIFSIRWSHDNRCIASGSGSGRIAVYGGEAGKTRYSVNTNSPHTNTSSEAEGEGAGAVHSSKPEFQDATVTCVRFRPVAKEWEEEGHYTLLSANSRGIVQHWKISSPNDLEDSMIPDTGVTSNCSGMHMVRSTTIGAGFESAAICLDYDNKGKQFVAGCKDAVLRIYDEETGKQTHTLDGGDGNRFEVGEKHQLATDRGWWGDNFQRENMSVKFQRALVVADSAASIVLKTQVKDTVKELNTQSVTTLPRHSNRVYSCKFAAGLSSPTDHLVLSGGWDNTVQLWDMRVPGPSVKSMHGAYLAGDALDVVGNHLVTGSYRYRDQLQIWDIRLGKGPVTIQTLEGNLSFAAGFSRGHSWEVEDRFVCCGGIGPGDSNNLVVFDHKRNNQVAAVFPDMPGGVVALDWSHITKDDLLTASKKMNSSKSSVAGGKIVVACGDDSIRVVEVCTKRSERFIDDDDERVNDGDETDSDLFETFMKANNRARKGGANAVDTMHAKLGFDDAAILAAPQESSNPDMTESTSPHGMPTSTKHTSSHSLLPDLTQALATQPDASNKNGELLKNKISPRASSLTSQSLPALPGAKPFPAAPVATAAAVAAAATDPALSTPEPKKSGTSAVPDSSDSTANIDTPTGDALIAAGDGIPSPFREGVDEHINQFLDDMEAA